LAILQLNNGETTEAKELVSLFLSSIDIRPRSVDTYRKALKQFFLYLDKKNITAPTKEDIIAFKNDLAAEHAAATISVYIIAVRQFFNWLDENGLYNNIAHGIKGARSPKGFRKDTLTIEQIKRTLHGIDRSTLEGKRNFAIINLLVRTGLRTIELHRANIEDIRQEAEEALLYIQGKGRDSKDAFVLLTEDALTPLREYINARNEKNTRQPLFISHSNRNAGGRLSTRTISRIIKEALRAAGLNDSRLSAHSLRHTAITLSLLGGASVQEAQTMARHSDINTTLKYAHNINRIKQAPEKKIDALLNGIL
jgi:integrase/recombinase XerD